VHIVKTSDMIRDEIATTKRATGLTWRGLAALPQFSPIPHGTLWAIYHGYPVPKKWRKRLGVVEPVEIEPCPHCGEIHDMLKSCKKDRRTRHRIAISKVDAHSAARSIVRNCEYTKEELIEELEVMECGK
jgi:hypothetical protein